MVKKTSGSDDLLGGITAGDAEQPVVDLLDEMGEGDEPAWVAENSGDGIQGVVLKRSTTTSEYMPGPVPVVTVRTPAGEAYRVIGYGSVLSREIEDADPRPGDTFAVKYFGRKTNKAGKEYHHYKVAVRRGTGVVPQAATPEPPF